MEENKVVNEATKKLSYEELEGICQQLSEQARNLYVKLQEANLANLYNRLTFLFKVLDASHMFDADFVEKCVNEVVRIMAVDDGDNSETENKAE